jgi:hypothetical protein
MDVSEEFTATVFSKNYEGGGSMRLQNVFIQLSEYTMS